MDAVLMTQGDNCGWETAYRSAPHDTKVTHDACWRKGKGVENWPRDCATGSHSSMRPDTTSAALRARQRSATRARLAQYRRCLLEPLSDSVLLVAGGKPLTQERAEKLPHQDRMWARSLRPRRDRKRTMGCC